MHAADLLTHRACLTPDREAIYDQASNQRYTYAKLNRRANRLANGLHQQLGLRKGERVAILAHNSIAYVDLLYGLGKLGAILTPLNWRLNARELIYILKDSSPRLLFCGPEFGELLAQIRQEVNLEQVIALEGAPFSNAIAYESFLENGMEVEPQCSLLDGEDPYCLLYTSGTTGNPKGALIPHRQVLWNAINTVISWGLSENDVAPILTPMFHSGGLFVFLTPLLYAGGRVVIARTFDPETSLHLIEQECCTVILGVPTLFQVWMNSPAFNSVDFSRVRFFISGGAPCPSALIQTWRQASGIVLRQGYGLTEVGVNCFSMTDEEAILKAGSVGKPIFHSQMRLVTPEGRDVPRGQTGELIIAGPHVCLGYWNNPQATAEALRDGWFHTGDMAYQDEEGFFYISGRLKDMIISGGENVYAAEVEMVFREHPAVTDAALIGQPDEKWGEVGLMVVACKPGITAGVDELLEFCRQRLARYKVPRRIEFVDSLPYSPYGKVIKAELRQRFIPNTPERKPSSPEGNT